MIDGPTEATDLAKTEENKLVVRGFVDEVLSKRRLERASHYIDPKMYIQHNPNVADGEQAMGAAFRKLDASGHPHGYDTIHKVLGEGDFVLTASEGTVSGTPTAFYDLFRVRKGLVVEHWDVLQTIPPRADWKNPNGKF